MVMASAGSPGAPEAPRSVLSRAGQWLGRLAGSLTRVALGLIGLAFLTGAGALVFVSHRVPVGRIGLLLWQCIHPVGECSLIQCYRPYLGDSTILLHDTINRRSIVKLQGVEPGVNAITA